MGFGDGVREKGRGEGSDRKEVVEALKKMKEGKTAGISKVVTEMIKAAEQLGVEWMTELCNRIATEGEDTGRMEEEYTDPSIQG